MTIVRVVYSGGPFDHTEIGHYHPAVLTSYAYIRGWQRALESGSAQFRDWVLDSGAYTAFSRGKPVVLQEYIDFVKALSDTPHPPSEVFALDVIGDWRASLANTEEMWRQGIEAIPCYHQGEPWDVAVGMAKDYPKMALGGMVGLTVNAKRDWCQEAFSRIWPARVHGFGLCAEKIMLKCPFESVDSANWVWPRILGNWKGFSAKGKWVDLKSPSPKDLSCEIRWYIRLERKMQFIWRRELKEVGSPCVASTA